jgi:hypothetical protein
VTEDGVD